MPLLKTLLTEVRACTLCAEHLPLGPRPVVQIHASARILIAGQAPGRKVHASGAPFDDASGERLREWMGVTRETFYDPTLMAILPMGFCYPGTGKSGDLPPRPECAPAWRERLLSHLANLELTLAIGQYAQAYHLPGERASLKETPGRPKFPSPQGPRRGPCPALGADAATRRPGGSLTELVQDWRKHWPRTVPLPHPSPRNNLWLKRNPWFAAELLPVLQTRIAEILGQRGPPRHDRLRKESP